MVLVGWIGLVLAIPKRYDTCVFVSQYLLSCQALSDQGIVNSNHLPKYDDLFSQNPLKIEAIGRILMQKYQLLITTMCTDISCAADNTDTQQAVDTVLSDLD